MRPSTRHPARRKHPRNPILSLTLAASVGALVAWPRVSLADVQHVVARGHTIEAIAHRYHVTVKAIVDANHLRDARHLRIGETLVIPGVQPAKVSTVKGGTTLAVGSVGPGKGATRTVSYAMRAKTPGVVHATRLATNEDFVVRVATRHGHVPPAALKSFERLMRSTTGSTLPPDPRLVALVAQVTNHFGSRKIEVISGFRPYSPTQYTAHSNHNIGRALDFRVVGVPNEVLRDYCKTLHNVGVGYYPNSTFVHLDVRDTPATWVDFSKPGEPPRYGTPGVDADEGTSDVAEQATTPESSSPGNALLAPLPPSEPPSPPPMPRDEINPPPGMASASPSMPAPAPTAPPPPSALVPPDPPAMPSSVPPGSASATP